MAVTGYARPTRQEQMFLGVALVPGQVRATILVVPILIHLEMILVKARTGGESLEHQVLIVVLGLAAQTIDNVVLVLRI